MTMKCPSCQFQQTEDRLDCECCGLVFLKWRERHAPSGPVKTSTDDMASPESTEESPPPREKFLYQQLAAMDFQQSPEGNWVYFPWGSFGKGYDGNDPETKKRISRFVSVFSCVHCPVLAILWTMNLLAWLYYPNYRLVFALFFMVYLIAAYVFFWLAASRWISNLHASTTPFNQTQYLKSFRGIFYWKYLVSFEVVALFLLLVGMWFWLTGNFFIFFKNHPGLVQRIWLLLSAVVLGGSTFLIYVRDKKKR